MNFTVDFYGEQRGQIIFDPDNPPFVPGLVMFDVETQIVLLLLSSIMLSASERLFKESLCSPGEPDLSLEL